MSRVMIIGLDGATFDIINLLIANGRLPNLAGLMQNGAWGTLQSTMPPITPTAWTSFFTGKNPGKHGIFDFQTLNRQTYAFETARIDRHREKSLWQLLSEAGLRSLVIDVPYTYPPQPINGWMITGHGTPRTADTTFTYPHDLAQQLPAGLQKEVRVAVPRHKFDRSPDFINEWWQIMNGRSRLLQYLVQEQPWDFFMTVFSLTDNMAHVFWTYVDPAHPNYHRPEASLYRNAFYEAYERSDQLLGQMIQWAGSDTTILVMSDHGFGSVRPRQYMFQRLVAGGFFHYQSPPPLAVLGSLGIPAAMGLYSRFPILREWVKNLQPKQQKALKSSLQRSSLMPTGKAIDPQKSAVLSANFGLQLWCNDDSFAQGIVHPDQRGELLQSLTDFLLADRDKVTGAPIIRQVYGKDRLYSGPFAAFAPDLVVDYANFYRPRAADSPRNPHIEGGHTVTGIFLATGSHIRPGPLQGARLIDLAPTVLLLLQQPIPPDMDGKVLTAALQTDYLQQTSPIRYADTPAQLPTTDMEGDLTTAAAADLAQQLRQLGYID